MSWDNMPDLSGSFPPNADDLRIHGDLNNPQHEPHYDVVQGIPNGVDQTRLSPTGEVLGGTTHFNGGDLDW